MEKKLVLQTDAENRAITTVARSDQDNAPLAEAQLAKFKREPVLRSRHLIGRASDATYFRKFFQTKHQ